MYRFVSGSEGLGEGGGACLLTGRSRAQMKGFQSERVGGKKGDIQEEVPKVEMLLYFQYFYSQGGHLCTQGTAVGWSAGGGAVTVKAYFDL